MNKDKISPDNLDGYRQHYSDHSLFSKLRSVASFVGRKVVYTVLLLYYVLVSRSTPLRYKQIIIGALGYFILPFDLLPDIIPVAGFTDDFAALVAVVKVVSSCITPEIKEKALMKSNTYF